MSSILFSGVFLYSSSFSPSSTVSIIPLSTAFAAEKEKEDKKSTEGEVDAKSTGF